MSHWHLRQASALRSSTLRSPTSFRESADYGHCWCYCVHDDCVCDREYDGTSRASKTDPNKRGKASADTSGP